MRKWFLPLLLLAASPLSAGDDIHAVGMLWKDFSAALRRGDYHTAHGLFSAESRAAMSYAEFIREYSPMSAAREILLTKPESQSTRLEPDWAEIAYSGVITGTGRPFRVVVSVVKNNGVWGLVAARNEAVERLEAAARAVLAEFYARRDDPAAQRQMKEWSAPGMNGNPVFNRYRFETNGEYFRALPVGHGLRTFHVDKLGMVKPGTFAAASSPPPAQPLSSSVMNQALPPKPDEIPNLSPAPARPILNGLPELTEPPPFPATPPGLEEMPEPPPPSREEKAPFGREVEEVFLPDTI
ncbi:MAG: hypothetical protein FWG74_07415 [Planctomycetes bacterium]|nr:hypothetical protein [Planctomycetota bacterium]